MERDGRVIIQIRIGCGINARIPNIRFYKTDGGACEADWALQYARKSLSYGGHMTIESEQEATILTLPVSQSF